MMISCRAAATKVVRQAVTSRTSLICCLSSHATHIPIPVTFFPLSKSIVRCLSTEAIETTEKQDAEQLEPTIDVRSSLPEGYTSGNVLSVLNKKCKGGKPLEHDDIRLMIDAAKTPKDTRLIISSLRKFAQSNKYILTTEMADLAVKRILEADPDKGPLKVLNNFNETSGLYYSCEIPILNLVLDDVLNHVGDYDNEEVWSALVSMLNLLIYRKNRPYRNMNKRLNKLYNKRIQLHHGPTAETVKRMVAIGLKINTAEAVHMQITEHCQNNKVPVSEETIRLVEDARFNEKIDGLVTE